MMMMMKIVKSSLLVAAVALALASGFVAEAGGVHGGDAQLNPAAPRLTDKTGLESYTATLADGVKEQLKFTLRQGKSVASGQRWSVVRQKLKATTTEPKPTHVVKATSVMISDVEPSLQNDKNAHVTIKYQDGTSEEFEHVAPHFLLRTKGRSGADKDALFARAVLYEGERVRDAKKMRFYMACREFIDLYASFQTRVLSGERIPELPKISKLSELRDVMQPGLSNLAGQLHSASRTARSHSLIMNDKIKAELEKQADVLSRMEVALRSSFKSMDYWADWMQKQNVGSSRVLRPSERSFVTANDARKVMFNTPALKAAFEEIRKEIEEHRKKNPTTKRYQVSDRTKKALRKGISSGTSKVFGVMQENMKQRRQALHIAQNPDPDFQNWYTTLDEQRIAAAQQELAKAEVAVVDAVLNGLLEGDTTGSALKWLDTSVEEVEHRTGEFLKETADYLEDVILHRDKEVQINQGIAKDGRKLQPGETEVVQSAYQAASQQRDQQLQKRAAALDTWKFKKGKFKVKPKFAFGKQLLKSVELSQSLRISKLNKAHDVNLSVKVDSPFDKQNAQLTAKASWRYHDQQWKSGGDVEVVVSGIRSGGASVKEVLLHGFAEYDKGDVRTGNFVAIKVIFNKRGDGRVEMSETQTHVSHKGYMTLDKGRTMFTHSQDFKFMDETLVGMTFKSAITYKLNDNEKIGANVGYDNQFGREQKDVGAFYERSWGPSTKMRVWAGAREINYLGEEKKVGAAAMLTFTTRF